jgi:hypothetical protein
MRIDIAGCGKTIWVGRNFDGMHFWDTGVIAPRMLKKFVQQGRSE